MSITGYFKKAQVRVISYGGRKSIRAARYFAEFQKAQFKPVFPFKVFNHDGYSMQYEVYSMKDAVYSLTLNPLYSILYTLYLILYTLEFRL